MRPKSGAFSRYRPRILTIIVLIVVAAPTVLANFSPSNLEMNGYSFKDVEYGWPLSWFWRNHALKPVMRYNWPRLAGNLAIWSVMLAVAGTSCEWLVRRYRPRLRWSLRTMLAAVGILAVFCTWCVGLRDRASIQDPLIAEIEGGPTYGGNPIYLNRWGPKWLDLVGVDRFRRCIVGVELWQGNEFGDEELLKRIGRLPDLRHLGLYADECTHGMAAAIGDLRQLRSLWIQGIDSSDDPDPERISDEVLTAIGKLNQLKVLSLSGMMFTGDSLPRLAVLTDLKSLRLEIWLDGEGAFAPELEDELEHLANVGKLPLLAHLPALPRLEAIGFHHGLVRVDDLRELSTLPRLKALDLSDTVVTDAALAELASLESLEELVIDDEVASAGGLESLLALKRLKALHIFASEVIDHSLTPLPLDKNGQIFVRENDLDRCRQALEALRQSNPGIVIDSDTTSFDEHRIWHSEIPNELPDGFRWPGGPGICIF